ncbi:hypothetical protein ACFQ1S_46180 [Kibdelosporangium lantanae]|uniref:MFS transporter n=1 Tax=Kibdelosporangium lantanae TaxID=1497396 RepID=A0ABW3MPJ9_9PSEU
MSTRAAIGLATSARISGRASSTRPYVTATPAAAVIPITDRAQRLFRRTDLGRLGFGLGHRSFLLFIVWLTDQFVMTVSS